MNLTPYAPAALLPPIPRGPLPRFPVRHFCLYAPHADRHIYTNRLPVTGHNPVPFPTPVHLRSFAALDYSIRRAAMCCATCLCLPAITRPSTVP